MYNKYLYWTPRVLTIIFIVFMSIFALDVFDAGYSFLELLVALFMHLIPVSILVVILLIAWRWEKIGGIIFILIGLSFTVFFQTYSHLISFLIISCPVFLIGVLFLISKTEFKKKAKNSKRKKKS